MLGNSRGGGVHSPKFFLKYERSKEYFASISKITTVSQQF